MVREEKKGRVKRRGRIETVYISTLEADCKGVEVPNVDFRNVSSDHVHVT